MAQRTIHHNYHQLSKLEIQYRFLYMLRDVGIKSANEPARDCWITYMMMIARVTEGG